MRLKTVKRFPSILKRIVMFSLVFFVSNLARAQETEKEALMRLSFMMGNWEGVSTSYNDGSEKTVNVVERVKYIMGGDLMVLDVKSPSIELHTIISYSVSDKSYYYQPNTKSRGGRYKARFENDQFLVTLSDKVRLTFERTEVGEFHEYGEKLVNGKWEKYFEDVLAPSDNIEWE